jgi:arabinofuranosyltransferase
MTVLTLAKRPVLALAPPRRWIKPWNIGMLALPVVGMGVLGFHRRWISDDGLITTRVVRQILAGHGPVTNVGERAEASTSTLWTWMLAAVTWITGRDPARIAVYLGLALTLAGIGFAMDGTRRLFAPDLTTKWLAPAGSLVVVALPPFWDFATSGLETGPMFGWMGFSWWLLVRQQAGLRRPAPWVISLVLGLGTMIRPELAVVAAIFLAALWLTVRPKWKQTLVWLASFGGIPFAYEIFRMGYYGMITPNTAISKEAGGTNYSGGWTYLMDTVNPYKLWFPLAVLSFAFGVVIVRRRRAEERLILPIAAVSAGIAMELYVIRIGGDFMHGRMNLPAIFLVMLPLSVLPLGRLLGAVVGLTAIWAVLCVNGYRVHYSWQGSISSTTGISDERLYYSKFTRTPNPDSAEPFIKANAQLADLLRQARNSGRPMLSDYGEGFYPMRADVGARVAEMWSYLGTQGAVAPLDEITLDAYTLSYPLGSHMGITMRGRPGHEKRVPDFWVVADYGDGTAQFVGAVPTEPDQTTFVQDVTTAREALSCGKLAELQHAVRDPMSVSRFWRNLTGAVSRTSLRFPEDPNAAVKEFCGK